jgi:putative spermidine/putrescine transport system substrate-binding protein
MPTVVRSQQEDNILAYGTRGGILEDIFRKAILSPLTAATGIQVKMVPYPEMAKVKAMVDTNTVDLDVWEVDGSQLSILGRRGLLEPIDYSLLPPDLKDDLLPGSIQKFGVGEVVFGAGIVYNSDRFTKQNHPRTWTEFWDLRRFAAPRTMPSPNYLIGPIEPALLADGVVPDQLYPLDVDRAFKSLDRVKPAIIKFWDTAADALNMMTSGNAELSMNTFGRAIASKQQNPKSPLEIEFNQGIAKLSYWVIPKGAKHVRNAHKFISFFCEPKNHAAYINAYPAYGPVSKKSTAFIDPKFEDIIITSAKNAPGIVMVNDAWWSEEDSGGKTNLEKVQERWASWAR